MITLIKEIRSLKGNSKGIFFILAFRTSHIFTKNIIVKLLGFPVRILYKIIIQWILGIDIDDSTKIGHGFNVFHGQGLIINRSTIIGNNVTIRQNTTIGNAKSNGGSPIINDNVEIGANSVIIGNITIGKNSVIAAGSVVVKNVQENVIVAGNPAHFIKYIKLK